MQAGLSDLLGLAGTGNIQVTHAARKLMITVLWMLQAMPGADLHEAAP